MRLTSFSITNFRSITSAHKIVLSNISTLVWKNNEWKSNILTWLTIAMRILKNHGIWKRTISSMMRTRSQGLDYDWERDFPIAHQSKRWSKETIFRLEFSLDEKEIVEFYKKIENYVNWRLLIEITINEDNRPEVRVVKSGKWAKDWFWNKTQKIAEYIIDHINFTPIPAIRTESQAIEIIQKMLGNELEKIEKDPDYIKALNKIISLQEPILEKLSDKIKSMLIGFIPQIMSVEITNSNDRTMKALRANCDVYINDGNKTKLEYKWDGVKSLVALSLLKDANQTDAFSLVAIEEPESHLHPWAIHLLRKAIYELWDSSQLIISTHNPLFVNRGNISSNIIINNWSAKWAKKIQDIRDVLGIQTSDNLTNSRFAIVVEWVEDEIAIRALFSYLSPEIKKAFDDYTLTIHSLKWASKLSYNLQLLRGILCDYHVILDRDDAWKIACKAAMDKWYLSIKEHTLAWWSSFVWESEFEDLINLNLYQQIIIDEYWVDLDHADFKNKSKKWSERVKIIFTKNWKLWDDDIKEELKSIVAESIKLKPESAIAEENMEFFKLIINSVELLISKN